MSKIESEYNFHPVASEMKIRSKEDFLLRNSQNSQIHGNAIEISQQDFQLFTRLKKMIDACVKMECMGCHQLIPTVQFFEHLLDIKQEFEDPLLNKFCADNISDLHCDTRASQYMAGSQKIQKTYDQRSKSVGKMRPVHNMMKQRDLLNQSAELIDEISTSQFKQKYINALNLINQYQAQIK